MKPIVPRIGVLCLLLVTFAQPTQAQNPEKKNLRYYAPLWTSSTFTIKPVRVPAAPEEGRPERDDEIEKLKKRIRELETEVRTLRATHQPKDAPAPKPPAAANEKFSPSEWLLKSEPAPAHPEAALSELEQLASREALRRGLQMKRRKILPTIAGTRYHRARVEIEVSGREPVFYQWIDRMHSPSDFRTVTGLTISPKRDDDTQVECRVQIERWILPERGESVRGQFPVDPRPELRPLTDAAHYPLELLLEVTRPLADTEDRLMRVEIFNRVDQQGRLARSIRVMGALEELKSVNAYAIALKGAPGLKDYGWTFPPPNEHNKTGRWEFLFDAQFTDR